MGDKREEDVEIEDPELPPTSETRQDDFSDAPSESSAADRRKYQRGGRKKSTSTREPRKSRIPPVPESQAQDEDEQYEQAERELIQDEPDEAIGEGVASPQKHKESICPNCAVRAQQKQHKPESPFETGIKTFNLRRAEHSNRRPIDIRATSASRKKKSKKQKSNKASAESETGKETEEEEEEEEEGDDEEQPRKPMSIRLDLNLMVEIFVKAKIKGNVTITFLE